MGLVILAIMALYFLIAIGVVIGAIAYARANGKSTKFWGTMAVLIMYMIPFWDLIPTVVAHKYACSTKSGFFAYKTLEKWEKENPSVMETLSMAHLPEQFSIGDRMYQLPDGTLLRAYFDVKNHLMFVEYKKPDGESGVQLNERFRRARKYHGPGLLKFSREESVIMDIGTNEILARQVDFRQSTKGRLHNGVGDSGWKFWFQTHDSCMKDYPEHFPNGGMETFVQRIYTGCPSRYDEDAVNDRYVISCPWRR